MTHEELMYSSKEDQEFYNKCVEGLPTLGGFSGTGFDENGFQIPYGCGPHSVKCLVSISEIVNPRRIFEIGFNMGYSAALWLELNPDAAIVTCDISNKSETVYAAKLMLERYGTNTFKYINRGIREFPGFIKNSTFDLAFIDGGHLFDDVVNDINLCQDAGIPFIAFDDIMEEFGPGVLPAIKDNGHLELIQEFGNIALYKNLLA